MSWELRGGRSYYYSAERVGGRVVKRYVGSGELAALAAQLDTVSRHQHESEGEADRTARADLEALEAALTPLNELAELMTRAAMVAAGFRQHHRGEWRRRREQNETDRAGETCPTPD
jgi:hypothetical protein